MMMKYYNIITAEYYYLGTERIVVLPNVTVMTPGEILVTI